MFSFSDSSQGARALQSSHESLRGYEYRASLKQLEADAKQSAPEKSAQSADYVLISLARIHPRVSATACFSLAESSSLQGFQSAWDGRSDWRCALPGTTWCEVPAMIRLFAIRLARDALMQRHVLSLLSGYEHQVGAAAAEDAGTIIVDASVPMCPLSLAIISAARCCGYSVVTPGLSSASSTESAQLPTVEALDLRGRQVIAVLTKGKGRTSSWIKYFLTSWSARPARDTSKSSTERASTHPASIPTIYEVPEGSLEVALSKVDLPEHAHLGIPTRSSGARHDGPRSNCGAGLFADALLDVAAGNEVSFAVRGKGMEHGARESAEAESLPLLFGGSHETSDASSPTAGTIRVEAVLLQEAGMPAVGAADVGRGTPTKRAGPGRTTTRGPKRVRMGRGGASPPGGALYASHRLGRSRGAGRMVGYSTRRGGAAGVLDGVASTGRSGVVLGSSVASFARMGGQRHEEVEESKHEHEHEHDRKGEPLLQRGDFGRHRLVCRLDLLDDSMAPQGADRAEPKPSASPEVWVQSVVSLAVRGEPTDTKDLRAVQALLARDMQAAAQLEGSGGIRRGRKLGEAGGPSRLGPGSRRTSDHKGEGGLVSWLEKLSGLEIDRDDDRGKAASAGLCLQYSAIEAVQYRSGRIAQYAWGRVQEHLIAKTQGQDMQNVPAGRLQALLHQAIQRGLEDTWTGRIGIQRAWAADASAHLTLLAMAAMGRADAADTRTLEVPMESSAEDGGYHPKQAGLEADFAGSVTRNDALLAHGSHKDALYHAAGVIGAVAAVKAWLAEYQRLQQSPSPRQPRGGASGPVRRRMEVDLYAVHAIEVFLQVPSGFMRLGPGELAVLTGLWALGVRIEVSGGDDSGPRGATSGRPQLPADEVHGVDVDEWGLVAGGEAGPLAAGGRSPTGPELDAPTQHRPSLIVRMGGDKVIQDIESAAYKTASVSFTTGSALLFGAAASRRGGGGVLGSIVGTRSVRSELQREETVHSSTTGEQIGRGQDQDQESVASASHDGALQLHDLDALSEAQSTNGNAHEDDIAAQAEDGEGSKSRSSRAAELGSRSRGRGPTGGRGQGGLQKHAPAAATSAAAAGAGERQQGTSGRVNESDPWVGAGDEDLFRQLPPKLPAPSAQEKVLLSKRRGAADPTASWLQRDGSPGRHDRQQDCEAATGDRQPQPSKHGAPRPTSPSALLKRARESLQDNSAAEPDGARGAPSDHRSHSHSQQQPRWRDSAAVARELTNPAAHANLKASASRRASKGARRGPQRPKRKPKPKPGWNGFFMRGDSKDDAEDARAKAAQRSVFRTDTATREQWKESYSPLREKQLQYLRRSKRAQDRPAGRVIRKPQLPQEAKKSFHKQRSHNQGGRHRGGSRGCDADLDGIGVPVEVVHVPDDSQQRVSRTSILSSSAPRAMIRARMQSTPGQDSVAVAANFDSMHDGALAAREKTDSADETVRNPRQVTAWPTTSLDHDVSGKDDRTVGHGEASAGAPAPVGSAPPLTPRLTKGDMPQVSPSYTPSSSRADSRGAHLGDSATSKHSLFPSVRHTQSVEDSDGKGEEEALTRDGQPESGRETPQSPGAGQAGSYPSNVGGSSVGGTSARPSGVPSTTGIDTYAAASASSISQPTGRWPSAAPARPSMYTAQPATTNASPRYASDHGAHINEMGLLSERKVSFAAAVDLRTFDGRAPTHASKPSGIQQRGSEPSGGDMPAAEDGRGPARPQAPLASSDRPGPRAPAIIGQFKGRARGAEPTRDPRSHGGRDQGSETQAGFPSAPAPEQIMNSSTVPTPSTEQHTGQQRSELRDLQAMSRAGLPASPPRGSSRGPKPMPAATKDMGIRLIVDEQDVKPLRWDLPRTPSGGSVSRLLRAYASREGKSGTG